MTPNHTTGSDEMTKRDEQAAEYAAEHHTDHDAAPAAIAVSDEGRPDKPAPSHRDDGTGDTSTPTLTDAEREALERLCEAASDVIADDKRAGGCHWQDDAAAVAVVRGLLARLGGDA